MWKETSNYRQSPVIGLTGLSHIRAHSGFCKNILRLCRLFFYLAADICHVDPEDTVIPVLIRPPYLAQLVVFGDPNSKRAVRYMKTVTAD